MQPELPASHLGHDPSLATQLAGFLDHAQFVRHLASGLVKDEHRREDVEQQTWLAAMENPPARNEGMGGWLKTVCRNFALRTRREDQRRVRRETVAAKPEGLPAAHEVVEREAMLQGVVQAVLQLPAPHREVILLRYYEDLPPRDIAKRLGVPPSTVHSRLQRAHAGLKERLDKEHGSRARWVSGLILLTGAEPARAISFGMVAAMAAGLVVVLSSLALWHRWPVGPERRAAPEMALRSEASATGTAPSTLSGTTVETVAFSEAAEAPVVAEWPLAASQRMVTVVGCVLMPGRHPCTQAVVSIFLPALNRSESIETDTRGCFEVELPVPRRAKRLECGIHARTENGRYGALRRGWIRSGAEQMDAGALMLRPASSLKLQLPKEPMGASARHDELRLFVRAYDYLSERYELRPRTSIPITKNLSQSRGLIEIPGLPACEYIATLTMGEQRGTVYCSLPVANSGREVQRFQLGAMRSLEATVVDSEGLPLSGVRLRLHQDMHGARTSGIPDDAANPIPPTDHQGRTVIRGASSMHPLAVSNAALLDHPNDRRRNHRIKIPAAASHVRVVVNQFRERIWQLRRPGAGSPGPKHGEAVEVKPWFGKAFTAGSLTAMCRKGHLQVSHWPKDAKIALAVAADGSMARLQLPESSELMQFPVAEFFATHDAEVLVRDAAGTPQDGVTLEVGATDSGMPHLVRSTTDDAGIARFTGLMPERLAIMPSTDILLGSFRKAPLGWIDISRGERRSEVTIRTPIRVRLQCSLDGSPGLPPSWLLVVPEGALSPVSSNVSDGTLDFRVWPDPRATKLSVMMVARGLWHTQHVISLPVAKRSDPITLPCALGRSPDYSVRVRPPADGWYDLRLESYARRERRWRTAGGIKKVRREDHLRVWEGMTLGTYRVRDLASGLTTEPITVSSKAPIPSSVLDLRSTGWATGVVETPELHDLGRSVVELRSGKTLLRRVHVDPNGRFRIRVSSGRRLQLVGLHPSFASGGSGAHREIVGPVSGLVLKLGPQSLARFRLPSLGHQPLPEQLSLRLRSSGGRRRMDLRLQQRPDGSYFFGGFRPGIWDLIVDAPGRPPQVLHDTDLEQFSNLGTLPIPHSTAALKLTVLLPPNQPVPPLVLEATGSEPIRYRRIATNRGAAVITLQNLSSGQHVIKAYTSADALVHHSRRWQMDLTPGQRTELTWDLR